jgi:hypothetical protein
MAQHTAKNLGLRISMQGLQPCQGVILVHAPK